MSMVGKNCRFFVSALGNISVYIYSSDIHYTICFNDFNNLTFPDTK